jgi:VanZ family protein
MNARIVSALRWLPFLFVAGLSLWVASGLPGARKPFELDLGLSPESLVESLGKVPHYKSTALLFVLATLAVGWRRLRAALLLTLSVGVGWELAEATAARHHARVADLAPDLVAALACVAVASLLRRRLRNRRGATTGAERNGG